MITIYIRIGSSLIALRPHGFNRDDRDSAPEIPGSLILSDSLPAASELLAGDLGSALCR